MGLSDNSESSFKMPQLQENWVKGLPDIFARRVIWDEKKRNAAWHNANFYFERNLSKKKYKPCYKSEDKDQLQSQFYYFEIINTRRYLISNYHDISGEYKDLERSINLAEDEQGNSYLIDFSGCQGQPIIHPYGVLLRQYMKEALKSGQRIDEDEFSTKISSASQLLNIDAKEIEIAKGNDFVALERLGVKRFAEIKTLMECKTANLIFFTEEINTDLKEGLLLKV
ncbi:hypothetical protein L3V83_02815 [Thiotrichales bacterium 19X7-9]|nr:hypothetical protein [Thiotrichales bacterium 19X7-9]